MPSTRERVPMQQQHQAPGHVCGDETLAGPLGEAGLIMQGRLGGSPVGSRPGWLRADCRGSSCSTCGPGSPRSPQPCELLAIAGAPLSHERLLQVRGM